MTDNQILFFVPKAYEILENTGATPPTIDSILESNYCFLARGGSLESDWPLITTPDSKEWGVPREILTNIIPPDFKLNK